MTQISSFFDANMVNGVPDREYDATSWANYFKGLIGNGVSITPSSNLQVVAGTGLNVILSPGIAYINGYYYNNTEPLTVPINIANATYPRITSIVIELSLNNREIICKTVDGEAQSSPIVPQITQTESTYQLQLATVYVPAGATSIGAITDTRENKEVCGFLELLAPTIPPTFLKNIILQGTTKNAGTIDGGTLNLNLINAPTINQPTINGGGLTNSILNIPHIENGTCLNTSIVLETKNGAKLDYFCDGKSFRLTNPATWEDLITIPESMDEIDVNVPINTNSGTYNNPTFEGNVTSNGTFTASGGLIIGNTGGELSFTNSENTSIIAYTVTSGSFELINQNTYNNIYSITPVETGNDTINLTANVNFGNGYTVNNPTMTGTCNINNGLYNNGTPVVTQQINIKGSVYITDTIQAYYTINYWVLDGGLLGSQNNSLNAKLGLMTISLYLDQTYTWNSGDPITLDIEGIPNVSAMTMTYNKAFNIGTGTNAVVINGIDSNGVTLNAYQTYTSQALLWGI